MNQLFKHNGDVTLVMPFIKVFSRKDGWKMTVTWGDAQKHLFLSNEFIDYQTIQIGEMINSALRECAAEGNIISNERTR